MEKNLFWTCAITTSVYEAAIYGADTLALSILFLTVRGRQATILNILMIILEFHMINDD